MAGKRAIAPKADAATMPEQGPQTTGPAITVHNANDYNWSSFLCPYCNASSFLKCSGGHLVCDGRVEMRHGKLFYQCFCGNAGFISGEIQDYEGDQYSMAVEPNAAKASTPLQGVERSKNSSTTVLPSATVSNSPKLR
jgi:hypothetical protein